jgi:hypothetical protein
MVLLFPDLAGREALAHPGLDLALLVATGAPHRLVSR